MKNTTSKGREAEQAVANYLQTKGHKLLAMNWRNRWCEIDVITSKDSCVYFTEVKFRMQDTWGGGFDYISQKKLQQMHFAAEYWLATNIWTGESELCAAEVDADMRVTFVEL